MTLFRRSTFGRLRLPLGAAALALLALSATGCANAPAPRSEAIFCPEGHTCPPRDVQKELDDKRYGP